MENREFRLEIRSAEGGGYEVEATSVGLESGKERGRFESPLVEGAMEQLRKSVELEIQRRAGKLPEEESGGLPIPLGAGPGKDDAEAIGQALFEALFTGRVRLFYERCASVLEGSGDGSTPMRIRLLFDHTDEKIAELSELPWELLCDEDGAFFGRNGLRPIVRDFTKRRWVRPLEVELPLRVLVIDAGDANLEAAREIEEIESALNDRTRFQVEILDHPDPMRLKEILEDQRIHVAHFICHGGFAREAGIGALFLRNRAGEKLQVNGADLAQGLNGLPDLRLLVFNSCLTASLAGRHGVASARLVRPDPPAIVGMQHGISHKSAIEFSAELYRALARGKPIDAAVSDARQGLAFQSTEWATPTLFLPSEDGRMLRFAEKAASRSGVAAVPRAAGEVVTEHAAARREGRRDLLAIHSMTLPNTVRWGDEARGGAVNLCPLDQHFDGRGIREHGLWRSGVFPELQTFLLEHAKLGAPLLLDFAAHSTIAYAAGWVLEAKSGLEIAVRQRGLRTQFEWSPGDGTAQAEPLWCELPDQVRDADASDVALALSASNDVAADVEEYLDRSGLRVTRLIHARVAPEPGQSSVAGGDHSLQLARRLAVIAGTRKPAERRGTLHLFSSAPNALLFYLGQLSHSFGRVQLYEYTRFGGPDAFGHYEPSLLLPPEDPSDAS